MDPRAGKMLREVYSLSILDKVTFVRKACSTLAPGGGMDWKLLKEVMNTLRELEAEPFKVAEDLYLRSILAFGGFGVVFAAERSIHGGSVLRTAVKTPWLPIENPELLKKFWDEVAALTKLTNIGHPGIVRVNTGSVLVDGRPYIEMEFVDGKQIEKLVEAKVGMPDLTLAGRLCQQIGDALEVIHNCKIVHRDITPSNILVTTQNQIKIIDFGIASFATPDRPLITTGAGTPHVAPLEQWMGEKSPLSDIHGFGVVAYYMSTGRYPELGNVVNPRGLRPDLSQEAAEIILSALAEEPRDRPQSARSMGEDLARALTSSTPPKPHCSLREWIGPGASFLLILAILVGVWWKSSDPRSSLGSGSPPQPPVEERTNQKDQLIYVKIPPGTSSIGCSVDDYNCEVNEKPVRSVKIQSPLWIGKTPVDQMAFQRVMGRNSSSQIGMTLPVNRVTFSEAAEYCGKIGLRLPTEEEWEYAARAGTSVSRYGAIDDVAWYAGNSGEKPLSPDFTLATRELSDLLKANRNGIHPVGTKLPNAWSLSDFLGNVYQWTSTPGNDSKGSPGYVVRGASYASLSNAVRLSARRVLREDIKAPLVGFRCAGPTLP